mmetsp:Transcript_34107/g.60298  ORF Transcript_34107/g.60298 Transcript_34107/m.60298 type:complete len:201 (-) Transcript_34107:391-993(-)
MDGRRGHQPDRVLPCGSYPGPIQDSGLPPIRSWTICLSRSRADAGPPPMRSKTVRLSLSTSDLPAMRFRTFSLSGSRADGELPTMRFRTFALSGSRATGELPPCIRSDIVCLSWFRGGDEPAPIRSRSDCWSCSSVVGAADGTGLQSRSACLSGSWLLLPFMPVFSSDDSSSPRGVSLLNSEAMASTSLSPATLLSCLCP